MRVMKNKATLLSLAVAGVFAATSSHAIVNMNTGATAAKYASEIVATSAVPFGIPATAATTAQVILGFGLSAAQQKYIRFDLTNAKFGAAVTTAMLTDFTLAGNLPMGNIIVAQGGTVGATSVIFQITATATGIPFTDVMQFALPLLNVTSTASTVAMTYALHDTAASAGMTGSLPVNSALLVTNTANMVTFATGNKWSFGTSNPEFVAATQSFKNFCPGAAGAPGTAGCATSTDVDAIMGSIASYTFDGTVLDATGTLLAMNSTINGATSKTILTGDFSAAASTYIDTTAGCTASSAFAGTTTATTATFTTANGTIAASAICFKATGTTAIAAQTFTGVFAPAVVGTTYAPVAYSSGPVGQFIRDGVELQSPWFTLGGTGSAYISRFFLTNTGPTASLCTVAFMSETGNTVVPNNTPNAQGNSAAGVTIPAGGQVSVTGSDLVTSFSGNARGAVRFSCPSPSANIQGRYVVTHTSGAVDSGTLLRPSTN